jgi:uncharacterized BrkB/YihY/UPF0761 family membrane protein
MPDGVLIFGYLILTLVILSLRYYFLPTLLARRARNRGGDYKLWFWLSVFFLGLMFVVYWVLWAVNRKWRETNLAAGCCAHSNAASGSSFCVDCGQRMPTSTAQLGG